jgi:glycerol-3-phosphate cytidylyltransferase-like family protein
MTRDELDTLWQKALVASVRDGEKYTRYHFAKLVAAAERRECVIACEGVEQATESQSWVVANCVADILARDGK